ncbi:DegT/DnrJ/EryC1/StrS family aminotransferase [Acidobacteria bacterium AH-259-L09]|nr:DegT/DnrJ/EryC1/StrS family aminotransferase [Acidobacteria bacterium AH-259-L09]
MTNQPPAALGGRPLFSPVIPLNQPTLPDLKSLSSDLENMFNTRLLTNSSKVRKLEEKVAELIGVRHAVAVSSCTSGLILAWRAYELQGEVILPSFTFSATGLALLWNGLRPRFVDIDKRTLNVDPGKVEEAIGPDTVGIMAVHIWGNPAFPERLENIARAHKLKLVFDSAHGLGALYKGSPIGQFGDAEVYSLSPTKLVVAGEGGIVTTNDDELARRIRVGRDYGNPGTYDLEYGGLNARMTEFNALLGVRSLEMMPRYLEKRQSLAQLYRERLGSLPGLNFQKITPESTSSYIVFGIIIDPEHFGLSRDLVCKSLEIEGITTRKYYDPVLHRQHIFSQYTPEYEGRLKVTEKTSANVLCLPMFSHMEQEDVEKISSAVESLHVHSTQIRNLFAETS